MNFSIYPRWVVAAAVAACAFFGATVADAVEAPLINAGVAVRDITPPLPILLGGYGPDHVTKKIDTRLSVTAIALSDQAGQRIVFVLADIEQFVKEFTQPVTEALAARDGLKPEQVLLISSHTHDGPSLPTEVNEPGHLLEYVAQIRHLSPAERKNNVRYGKELQQTLIEVVEASLKDLKPSKLRYGIGRATFAMNRRIYKEGDSFGMGDNFDGPVDWDVPVLEIKGADGALRAVLFGYACHATTLGRNADAVSADYVGYTRKHLATVYPGVVTAYAPGFAGDSNPYPGVGADPQEDGTYKPAADGGITNANRHGLELAGAVAAVLARPMQPVTGKISLAYGEVDLPLSTPPSREQLEKDLAAEDASPSGQANLRTKINLDVLKAGGKLPESIRMPVVVLRIGERFLLLGMGGEVLVDYAVRLKRLFAPQHPWFASMVYYCVTYIPSARAIKEGGFEPDISMRSFGLYGPYRLSIEDIIVKKVVELSEVKAAP